MWALSVPVVYATLFAICLSSTWNVGLREETTIRFDGHRPVSELNCEYKQLRETIQWDKLRTREISQKVEEEEEEKKIKEGS